MLGTFHTSNSSLNLHSTGLQIFQISMIHVQFSLCIDLTRNEGIDTIACFGVLVVKTATE